MPLRAGFQLFKDEHGTRTNGRIGREHSWVCGWGFRGSQGVFPKALRVVGKKNSTAADSRPRRAASENKKRKNAEKGKECSLRLANFLRRYTIETQPLAIASGSGEEKRGPRLLVTCSPWDWPRREINVVVRKQKRNPA